MTNRLTVHNATIRTATIEVRTLTLNGKQMTLSVFRQLQEESILDGLVPTHSTGVRGVGWGWVHYCPGASHCVWGPGVNHRHLVWQLGEELRRWPFHMDSLRSPLLPAEVRALEDLPQLFIAV